MNARLRFTFSVGALLATLGWLAGLAGVVLIGLDLLPIEWGAAVLFVAIVAMTLTVGAWLERLARREAQAFEHGREYARVHPIN